jgi:hypothetical protein
MFAHQLIKYLILLGLISSCDEFKEFKGGGFGSINGGDIGNTSSLVTISGRVMSTATFNSFESQALSAQNLMAFRSALQSIAKSYSQPSPLITTYAGVDSNDCSGAIWTMSYVGEGASVVKSGTAAIDGSFEVPSVPEGKEGLMIFECGTSNQKCLVKGGDESVSCNSIADGVVGALEVSLGKELTHAEFKDKTVSKVASSIVEGSNSDSADAETLKSAVSTCKAISNEPARKTCYKNSIMSSGQSANFEVVKTLAQDWDVPRLFNFLVGSMGISIEIDNFIYGALGELMDEIFQNTFISQTKNFIKELIDNPDYVGGNSANGEQTVKIACVFDYVKPGRGGSTSFKAELDNDGLPHCAIETALRQFTGIQDNQHPNNQKLLDFLSVVQNSSGHDDNFYQVGIAGPADCESENRWNIAGNFCLRVPKIFIKSKLLEPDRNDPEGIFGKYKWEDENKANLVKPSSAIDVVAMNMVATSNSVSPSDYRYECFKFVGGGPEIKNTPACKDWIADQLSPKKTEFRGLIGVYMFLTDPATYKLAQTKLSLNDIHNVFTKNQFLNSKLLANSSGTYGEVKFILPKSGGGTQDLWLPPVLDVNTGLHPFVPNLFLRQMGQNGGRSLPDLTYTVDDAVQMNSKGDLSGSQFFNLTFGPFLNIPTTSQIQSFVQYESRHQPWNPFGDQYYDIPGVEINVSGLNKKFPIYCRLLNRDRLDNNSNPIPMVKELNPSSLIECLSNPTTAGVSAGTEEGDYNYVSTFNYPFVLQSRGFQGDSMGQLFTLIDRKSGQQVRVGGSEIMILQAHAGNSSIMVNGSCPQGFSDNLTSDAPIVKAQFTYGTGSFARSEIVSAYCLNFTGIMVSDTNTIPYTQGKVSVSQNGTSRTMPSLAGRLTSSSSFDLEEVCLFASSFTFEPLQNSPKYGITFTAGATANVTSSYTISYNTNQGPKSSSGNKIITALLGTSDFIDFCDETHSGTSKYSLSPAWDNTNRDVLSPSRDDVPIQIINSSNTLIQGFYISLGAIEGHYPTPILKVANSTGRTWFHNTKLLNKKYNAKFDPFCDDRNNNGKCDCYDQNLNIKAGQCNLGDFAAEPTLSRPPYWKNQDNSSQFVSFFNSYGGKSGADLAPLNGQYFNTNNLHMRLEDIMFCQYLKTGETTYRRPTMYIWGNFANLNFPGCPNSSGNIIAFNDITDPLKAWHPTTGPNRGGGPVRIIRPREMNNSYAIAYPRKFTTILNYATKSIGQGVTIDPTKKLFSFDEAVALIEIRRMLQPKLDEIYDSNLVYNQAGNPLDGVSPSFISINTDPNSDQMDTPSAVFLGLTNPALLSAP